LVALVNPDCVPDPGCLATLTTHLRRSPGVGVAAAVLRYPDGSVQDFARREQGAAGYLLTHTDLGKRIDEQWLGGRVAAHRRYAEVFAAPIEAPVVVDCPAAACVVLWRRPLEPRPMDPALPLMFNDGDLYRRLRSKGYRCEIVPDAAATHLYGASLRRVPRARMRAETVAALRRYSATWGPLQRWALWLGLAADGAAGVVETTIRPGGAQSAQRGRARGTLGGLGLPGGVEPWLTPPATAKSGLRGVMRRGRQGPRRTAVSLTRRLRRQWFIVRLKVAGWWTGSAVTLAVDPTADIAWSQRLEIRPRSRVEVRVGQRTTIREGVALRLAGTLDIGDYCDVRWDCTLNVKGLLRLEGRNTLGRGVACHVDGTMRIGWGTIVGEYSSLVDNDHGSDGSLVHPYDQPNPANDVTIGPSVFVAVHSVVTSGVTIGAAAVVGSNSVVTGDIPAGVLAVGAPARPVKDLPHREG
jgi:acetyltransferase-like isoleucine patch superfamily enzyme